ncbi:MAG: zinc-ribbon domain-containing protein [Candidatus Cloacimonadota bacterium]|nr:zinc-ribbon domain-containing protein [Candidatus Cloacimonadota bacterium]
MSKKKNIKCRSCGKKVSINAKRCHNCGTLLKIPLAGNIIIIALLAFIVLFILLAIIQP